MTPQRRLTRHEIERLPMGNQHTKWNVIKWQVVKGAAVKYNVPDWTSKVDTSLTYEENCELMRLQSTAHGGPSVRELAMLTDDRWAERG